MNKMGDFNRWLRERLQRVWQGQGALAEARRLIEQRRFAEAELRLQRLATRRLPESQALFVSLYLYRRRWDLVLSASEEAIKAYGARQDSATRRTVAALWGMRAHAAHQLGQLNEALVATRKSLGLDQSAQQPRPLLTKAAVLQRQQRLEEAEACYEQAQAMALSAPLRGLVQQRYGLFLSRQQRFEEAIDRLQQALTAFDQRVEPAPREERYAFWPPLQPEREWFVTADILATAYVQGERLDEAGQWYQLSYQRAAAIEDREHLAVVDQNIGILYQKRAEACDDPEQQQALYRHAIVHIQKSLDLKMALDKKIGAEASYFQLGILHWKLKDYHRAKAYLETATKLAEALGLPHVYKNYSVLAFIAREQADSESAQFWQNKCDAKVLELKTRRLEIPGLKNLTFLQEELRRLRQRLG